MNHSVGRTPAARCRTPLGRLAGAVVLVATGLAGAVTLAAVGTAAPAAADTAQPACSSTDPFTPGLAAQLAANYPRQRFSAEVYDERSGCTYDLHPDLRLTTASVLKVEVMAGILLRAQSQGRPLTASENSLIFPMITQSHDAPTNVLWQSLGGAPGMTNLDHTFGLTGTTQVGPEWGVTVTSARDQVHLLRQVVVGDFGPLGPAYRADAYNYLAQVIPAQRWGIGAGVPANWHFVNKNGFAGSNCCAWRINSTGVVYSPSGPAYTVAILSDGWPDEPTGIAAVETVSRAIAARLTTPMAARPAVGTKGDGSLEVFGVSSGRLLTSWQGGPNAAFGGWLDLGVPAPVVGTPAVVTQHNGGLQVFVRTVDDRLLTSWQPGSAAPFGGWLDLGLDGQVVGDPGAGTQGSGAVSVVVSATGGRVLSSSQGAPNQPFGGWLDLHMPASASGAPAVATEHNGGLQVFVHTVDNRLLTSWQAGSGASFGGWLDLGAGGQIAGDATVGVQANGALSVLVAGTGGRVLNSWQAGADQPFGGWLNLGSPVPVVGPVGVARGGNGGLQAVVQTADNRLLTSWQSGPGAPFGGWLDLGADGQIGSAPAVAANANGGVQVFVRSAPGGLLTVQQSGAGQPFSAPADLGMPH